VRRSTDSAEIVLASTIDVVSWSEDGDVYARDAGKDMEKMQEREREEEPDLGS